MRRKNGRIDSAFVQAGTAGSDYSPAGRAVEMQNEEKIWVPGSLIQSKTEPALATHDINLYKLYEKLNAWRLGGHRRKKFRIIGSATPNRGVICHNYCYR
jgi:hypothetical protein